VPETSASPTLTVWRGDPDAVVELLSLPGALLTGHFRLLSGLHSNHFIAFSRIAGQAGAVELLSDWMVPSLAPLRPDLVLAPSTAGVGLGWSLAQRLGCPLGLASLDAQGRPAGLLGEESIAGRSVLLVNDVVTTGDGLSALAALVRQRDANVAAATWFASRAEVDVASRIGAPTVVVADLHLDTWSADECPACANGLTLDESLDLN
jgi:orotate phosphoribosyltransferase